MTSTTARPKALAPDEGLRLQSGPGRDLVFKLTGDETRAAIDYFVCEVAPHGGPPLHVHHEQDETLTSSAAGSRSGSAMSCTHSSRAASPTSQPACRTRS